jgi:hypothetical protein
MAGESGSGKVQTFATIVTTLLAVAAFIQSLSTRQQGASTQTASRKSYGAVGGQIEQLGQASEQQSAAIEKLWEAVSNIQNRPPASLPSAPIASLEPAPTPHHARTRAPAPPASVQKAAPPAAPPPPPARPQTPQPGAKALGQLQLQHFVEKKLPSYDEFEK